MGGNLYELWKLLGSLSQKYTACVNFLQFIRDILQKLSHSWCDAHYIIHKVQTTLNNFFLLDPCTELISQSHDLGPFGTMCIAARSCAYPRASVDLLRLMKITNEWITENTVLDPCEPQPTVNAREFRRLLFWSQGRLSGTGSCLVFPREQTAITGFRHLLWWLENRLGFQSVYQCLAISKEHILYRQVANVLTAVIVSHLIYRHLK